ncbi:SI1L3 protein, partial [Chordeiles acutipennis]|nr:SI1L3 protein [Chordeiles acutipennis]
MGVRARIADWPPKKDSAKDSPPIGGTNYNRDLTGHRDLISSRNFLGGHQPLGGVSGLKTLQRLTRRRSKEVEFQEGWSSSTLKGWPPLRHRSSSEVTLSECDPEEPGEPR